MDEHIKNLMDSLGIDPDTTEEQNVKSSDEQWDVFRLTKEVANMCAAHSDGCACIFAATPVDDEEGDSPNHVALMIGGAPPDSRAFGDMIMAIGGKLFNATYDQKHTAQMIVHRERNNDCEADDAGA